MHFDNEENTIHDSAVNRSWTRVNGGYGLPSISTADKKYGIASLSLTISQITTPDSVDFHFDSDFTIHLWFKPTQLPSDATNYGFVWSQRDSVGWQVLYFNRDRTLTWYFRKNDGTVLTNVTTASTISLNSWSHIAVVRRLGIVSIYINGVSATLSGTNDPGTYDDINAAVFIGGPGIYELIVGYVDEVYVIKGTSIFTSDFDPETINSYQLAMGGGSGGGASGSGGYGGSGGGAAANYYGFGTPTPVGGTGIAGQGNNGSIAFLQTNDINRESTAGGSGGGAGSFALAGNYNAIAGNAVSVPGDGVQIWGDWYGAGGSGATQWLYASPGGKWGGGTLRTSGAPNSGGGGGATNHASTSGSGGSGRIIIRYPFYSTPAAPTNVSAITSTTLSSKTIVSWTAPSHDGNYKITDYVIQYSVDNTNWTTATESVAVSTIALIDGLTDGIQYYIRVAAKNQLGIGTYSSSATVGYSVVSDSNFEDVVLLLLGNGSDNSTTILDSSDRNNGLAIFGNTRISTAQSKFGGSSIYLDGTGDYLVTIPSSDFGLNGDYTLEAWIYPTSVVGDRCLFDTRLNSTEGISLYTSLSGNSNRVGCYDNASLIGTPATNLTANTWTHIAVSKQGTTLRCYINGTLSFSATDSRTYAAYSSLTIGANWIGTQFFAGYINDIRITKKARHTSNFTPSTSQSPTRTFNNLTIGSGPSGVSTRIGSARLSTILSGASTRIGSARLSTILVGPSTRIGSARLSTIEV